MANDNEQQLAIAIEGRITNLEKAMQKAAGIVDTRYGQMERRGRQARERMDREFTGMGSKLEGTFSRIGKGFDSFGESFKGAFLGSLGIGGAAVIIDKLGESIERLNDVGEIAGRTGFTTDMVQAFQELGREATASIENTNKALQAFTEQSATSGSFLQKLFAANGKAFDLKNPIANLKTFMDLVKNADSDAQQLALVTGVVGDRAGRELTEAFKRGGDAVDQAFEKMKADGRIMSEAQVEEAGKIKAAYIELAADIETLFQKLAVGIAGPMFEVLDKISKQVNTILADMKAGNFREALIGRPEDWDFVPDIVDGGKKPIGEQVAALVREQVEVEKQLAEAKKLAGSPLDFWNAGADVERLEQRLAEIKEESARLIAQGRAEMAKAMAPPKVDTQPDNKPPVTIVPTTQPKPVKEPKASISDLEREIATIQLRSAALNQNAAILTGLIGKEDDHGFAMAKAEATRELLTAAEKDGIPVTTELKAQIDQIASAYAASVVAIDSAKDKQKQFTDAQKLTAQKLAEFKSGAKDTFLGFISDMQTGVGWAQSLYNALNNIAQKLIEIAATKIFEGPAGDAIFGSIMGLFGFADGGKVSGPGGPRDDRVPILASDGEFVVNAESTKKYEKLLRAINEGHLPAFAQGGKIAALPLPDMPRMASPGRSPIFNIAPTINVEGGSRGPAADRELADKISQAMEKTVRGLVQSELVEQTRPGNLLGRVAAY